MRTSISLRHSMVLVAALLGLTGCERPAPVVPPGVLGHSAPASLADVSMFHMPGTAAENVEDATRDGKVVVLFLFATWCPVSRSAISALQRVQAQFPGEVTVIAIDEGDRYGEVAQFADQLSVSVPIALDFDTRVGRELGAPTVPMIVVMNRGGVVRHVHVGFHGEEDTDMIRDEVAQITLRHETAVARIDTE
jgi:thiol-disulfide isomerase/thioredoxin